jgi:hypothetical protein
MASEQSVGAGAAGDPSPRVREQRHDEPRPFYADPLRLAGWAVALLALFAYWWLFVRREAPAPGMAVARLTAVAGRVRVQPNGREGWVEGRLAALLHVGDRVETAPRSGAEISFDSGSVVTVRSDSIVFVGGSAESSTAAWRVSSGRVNFAVGDREAEILTPSARTRALPNAVGQLDVTQAGTGLKVFDGNAELQTRFGERVLLSANEAVRVDTSGHAGTRRALPPPPRLQEPAPRSSLPYASPPSPVATLRWTASPGATSYRVALDFNITQANLLLSAALELPGLPSTSHALTGMDPGRYFWRVAGVTADGEEGAFSRVSLFTIQPPAPVTAASPPLPPTAPVVQVVEDVGSGIVRVAGRAPRGSVLTINGIAVMTQADGSFNEYLRLSAGGELRVRSTTEDGRVAEQVRRVGER